MRGLTPRERRILEMRFFGGCTQAEIGAEVGVTQMQVSRLLSRLLTRMRKRLEETGPGAPDRSGRGSPHPGRSAAAPTRVR